MQRRFKQLWSGAVLLVVLIAFDSLEMQAAVLASAGSAGAPQPPPVDVTVDSTESDDDAILFLERRNLVLPGSVSVDVSLPGTVNDVGDLTPDLVALGTRVDSYFLHADPIGAGAQTYGGSVRFDRPILGVMLTSATITASNTTLGAAGTSYPPTDSMLELGADQLSLSADRRTLQFTLATSVAVDHVRILTEPTAAWNYRTQYLHRVVATGTFSQVIEDRIGFSGSFATPSYNPGGGPGVSTLASINLRPSGLRWNIEPVGGSSILAAGASFNILHVDSAVGHTSSFGDITDNFTVVDDPALNGQPNLRLLVQSWDTDGLGVTGNFPSVFYHSAQAKWAVFLQDTGVGMESGASFFLLPLPDDGTSFVHAATSATSVTVLDDPRLNGKPDALLHLTQVWNPGGGSGIYNNHPVAVAYDVGLDRWTIRNDDGANFTVGASFNVFVPPAPSFSWQHEASPSNVFGHITDTTHIEADGSTTPILLETQNLAPTSGAASGHAAATGIYYSGIPGWSLFSEDAVTPYPVGAASNLYQPPIDLRTFVHFATFGNTLSQLTFLDHPLTDLDPDAIVFATRHWDKTDGVGGVYSDHDFGVYYDGTSWSIFNEDLASHDPDVAYNVHVAPPTSQAFTHIASPASVSGDRTTIDDPRTNAQPDLRLLITHNRNPSGATPTYNAHPTGVDYDSTAHRWQIVNLDGAAMPTTAAFNVLPVPEPAPVVMLVAGALLIGVLRWRRAGGTGPGESDLASEASRAKA
jgi:hypothetical protein